MILSPGIFTGMVPGGHWSPSSCIPRQRVAIIIPFRDRASHLDTFLQVFHPFLQKQMLSYSIFVIEQVNAIATVYNDGYVVKVKKEQLGQKFFSARRVLDLWNGLDFERCIRFAC